MVSAADWKRAEARNEALPSYDEAESQSQPSGNPVPTPTQGPTPSSPFNFQPVVSAAEVQTERPAHLPTYASSTTSTSSSPAAPLARPVAIPQLRPEPAAALLDGYASALLALGIPPASFRNFLATLSAFLAARVSEQALAHAADVGRRVTDVPRRFTTRTADRFKSVGARIRNRARSGNYLGAAVGAVVQGGIGLPVGTAFRAAGAAIALPFAALGAVVTRPKTPRERAVAYAAVANKDWFGPRGLHVVLMDSAELERSLGLEAGGLLGAARKSGDATAAAQMRALEEHLMPLEVHPTQTLELGPSTLWLVIVPREAVEEEDEL